MYYIKCNYAWNNKAVIGKIYETENLKIIPDFALSTWERLVSGNLHIKNPFEIVKVITLEEEIY